MNKTITNVFKRLTTLPKRDFSFKPFKLPDLSYDYNELEPVMSAQILEVHHKKHHQAYVNNFNIAAEQLLSANGDLEKIVNLQSSIKFNGGSHINHSIFWTNLSPVNKNGGKLPAKDSPLAKGIVSTWGSFEKFIEEFSRRATAVQVLFHIFFQKKI